MSTAPPTPAGTRAGAEIARRFGDIVDRFTLYTPHPLAENVRRRAGELAIVCEETSGYPAPAEPTTAPAVGSPVYETETLLSDGQGRTTG